MPQEKSDARKLERELKIKFEWREADKNLEKEERNKPLDLASANHDLLALETRAWRSGDASAQPPAHARHAGSPPKGGSGSGFRSRSGGGGFSGGRNFSGRSNSSRPGSSRSGPARRGQ
jgi:ATP-dependent RNA helicase RhlE